MSDRELSALAPTIRLYRPEDRPQILALVEKYATKDEAIVWADLEHPHRVGTVVVEKDGRIVAAVTMKLTSEHFFAHDPEWGSPGERWEAIVELLGHAKALAKDAKSDELHLFVPQGLKRYAERLRTVPGVSLDDRLHLILFVNRGRTEEAGTEEAGPSPLPVSGADSPAATSRSLPDLLPPSAGKVNE